MKQPNKSSLADKISGLLNAAPSDFNPEEEEVDDTNAQLEYDNAGDVPEDEEILSKFRRANVDLLADLDQKYAGKRTSRKNLKGSESEGSGSETAESQDGSDTEEDENGHQETSSEEKTDDEDSNPSSDGSDSEEHFESFEEGDDSFNHLKETKTSNEIQKGLCVRNQMALWESLLEVRIQLQKCLFVANKLPTKEIFTSIKEESGSEFTNNVNKTKSNITTTLDKLLLLQTLLLKQYPETKNLGQGNKNPNEDDEEIPSDTDNEEEIQSDVENQQEEPKGKKRKLTDYEHELTDHHQKYKDYRNSVIQKWNDKTRLVVKGASSHSVLDQIEYNLSNKEKLIKKTQLNRSLQKALGEEATNDGDEHNTEIFNDDDFYHQLLRELIEVKSADITDPVKLGQQWIQLQSLRSKMKRKIDTKATKGRKIRYAVHSKLVNFMAPIDGNFWTDEAKNELYNSLFGKNQTANV